MSLFCPFYNLPCPQNGDCKLWDTGESVCTFTRQKNVLEMIMGSTGVHLHSEPPTGYYKVLNVYYDETADEHVVIREDTPI